MCNNMRFVWAFRNGHSKDLAIYTLAKLIFDVGKGLGANVRIIHTGRRTSVGDQVVDHLSKHEMSQVASLVPGMTDVSTAFSPVLRSWIMKPVSSRGLGRNVLVELNRNGRDMIRAGL